MDSADGQSKEFENEQEANEFDVVNNKVSEMSISKIPRGVLVESTREILNATDTHKIVVESASMKEVSKTGQSETIMEKKHGS